MSKIVKETGYRELSHIVQTKDGKRYLVDSNNTFDVGYETMVFLCGKWNELFVKRYQSEKAMRKMHYKICGSLESLLERSKA